MEEIKRKVRYELIDTEYLLSEATTARKKTKPRKMSLNLVKNKARVLDVQKSMTKFMELNGHYQTISVEDFVTAQNKSKVPLMVRRCIARVQPKMRKDGQGFDEAFTSAIQICTWVFQRHGFIRKGSRTYAMNGKGTKRNGIHQKRKDASRYENQFGRLYNSVFKASKASAKSKKEIRLGKSFKASGK